MYTSFLEKTFNVSGIPHTDTEGNIRPWIACGGGIIPRTGFQMVRDLEKLQTQRDLLEGHIKVLKDFMDTAQPIPKLP